MSIKSLKSMLSVYALALFIIVPSIQAEELSADQQVAGLEKMCKEAASAIKNRQAKKSLYLRLGGESKIRTFSTLLYAAHKSNDKISHFFVDSESGPVIENLTKFLVVGTGGKGEYKQPSMENVHRNMKIRNEDFLAAGADVQSTMKGLEYGENEIQEMVCALVSFIPVVVTR